MIKYEYGHSKDGDVKALLLVNDIPIIKWHAEEYYCPTCEKLLSAGNGLNNVQLEILEIIRSVTNMIDYILKIDIATETLIIENNKKVRSFSKILI
ncbi:MAG: hypothetical protein H7Y18_01425 [Clostridiaceae bacterium]|nr:hypothetical protein [Clostridiaceae bacterium]